MKTKKITDIVIAGFLVALGVFVYVAASKMPDEAGMFPKAIALLTVILALILGCRNALTLIKDKAKGSEAPASEEKPAKGKRLVVMIAIVAYPIAMILFGYIASTLLFVVALAWLYSYRNLKILIPTAVLLTGVLYVAFDVLLRVDLPVGLIFGGEFIL